jgi:hypothetical protein
MNKMVVKPAGFSKSALSDSTSIAILNELLDRNNTFPDIQHNDKTPNTDGFIWLHTESDYVGKIEVQVKTLRPNYKTPSLNANLKLLAYAKVCQLPFFILAVDQTKKLCFWYHLTSKHANELIDKALLNNKKSIAIHFDKDSVLPTISPYTIWKNIANEHLSLLNDSEELKEKLITSQELLNAISANNGTKDENPANIYLNTFLDKLNTLFNNDFSVLKNLFAGEFWKFGITVFGNFSDTQVTYSLFSIQLNENVRDVFYYPSNKSIDEFRNERFNWSSKGGSNPFVSRPKEYAYEKIQDYLNILIDRKILWANDENLINEYLFFISDTFRIANESGSFEEVINIELKPFKKAIESLNDKLIHEQKLALEFPQFERSLPRALDYIQKLRLEGHTTIMRKVPSRPNLLKLRTDFTENSKIPERAIDLIEQYINCLENSYENFIEEFFPLLKKEIRISKNYNTEIITIRTYTIRGNQRDKEKVFPIILFVRANDPQQSTFVRIFEKEPNEIDLNPEKSIVEYKGKKLDLIEWVYPEPNAVFGNDQMPLRWGIYKRLQESFDKYFINKKKGE